MSGNKMALDALKFAEAALADIGDADREPGDDLAWCEARAAEALPRTRAAIAALQAEPPPAPYLCIAPACGPKCSDCNSAISDVTMRRYAIRYAYLRDHDPRFGMPTAWLAFQTLDEAIDAALTKGQLAPQPQQEQSK